jgi:dTDP-4-dehydrorhamnose 3,5-epimerase-like enzyme
MLFEKVLLKHFDTANDSRGESYPLSDILSGIFPNLLDCHISSILPGAYRGNHYHSTRNEILIVKSTSNWTLYLSEADSPDIYRQVYSDAGITLLNIPLFLGHTIENTGDRELMIISLTNGLYRPESGETVKKSLFERNSSNMRLGQS